MADYIELSAGAGGAKMRAYTDATGYDYAPAAIVYMTSVADGAAVAQPVQVGHGLPVQQDGSWTVTPGDTPNTVPWLASISQGGHTATVDSGGNLAVLATISGTVAVGSIASVTSITNPVTVIQPTAGSLHCTANIASGQTLDTVTNVATVGTITNPVASAQSGAWNVAVTGSVTTVQADPSQLLCTASIAAGQTLDTVTNVGSVTSITNPVTVVQPTAGNFLCTANLAANQTLATVTNVTTLGTITNPVGVAAGTNLIGKTSAAQDTSTIYNGTTALTPTFAVISASASGDNQIVAAVAGKKIRVLQWSFASNGTVSAKWRSGTTDLTGSRPLIQYAMASGSFSPVGRFETAVNQALNLNLTGAIGVGGELAYVLV